MTEGCIPPWDCIITAALGECGKNALSVTHWQCPKRKEGNELVTGSEYGTRRSSPFVLVLSYGIMKIFLVELCRLTVNCFLENLSDLFIIKFKMAFSSFEIMGRGQFFTESW